ncbi:hypothetical protein ACFLR1_04040 [Bacteroidota bacterium]
MRRRRSELNYKEDLTVPELASKYRMVFYDLVLEAVIETISNKGIEMFQKSEPKTYNLVDFEIDNLQFSITILRASVFGFLKRGVEYFESTEQYEKCAKCQRMVLLFEKNVI